MSSKIWTNRNRVPSKYLAVSGLALAFCFGSVVVSAQENQQGPGEVSATPMQQDQQGAPEQAPPYQGMQQQAPPNQVAPPSLTIPAGTVIRVRTDEWLSTDRNFPGDTFDAVLEQPIVVDGWVIARRGQSENRAAFPCRKSRGMATRNRSWEWT